MPAKLILILLIPILQSGHKLPIVNQKVVEYVKSVMGTQVGTGECTDLIMNTQYYIFKIKDDRKRKKSDNILPGDFITFDGVSMGGLSFPQHAAIIMEVKSSTVLVIAHQNHNGNKTVQELEIDLARVTSGKYYIQPPK